MFRNDDGSGDCVQYSNRSIGDRIIKGSALINCFPLIFDFILIFLARNLNLYVEPVNDIDLENHDEEETSV